MNLLARILHNALIGAADILWWLANSRWAWQATLFYPLYNRAIMAATAVNDRNNLGLWQKSDG